MRIRLRTLVWTAVAIVAFGIGIALGEALHDNPGSGDTRTLVRTLAPLPIAPAHETVTVTVTQP